MAVTAGDLKLPMATQKRLPTHPGKRRRYLRQVGKILEENALVRSFCIRNKLQDQIPWILYYPHYKGALGNVVD